MLSGQDILNRLVFLGWITQEQAESVYKKLPPGGVVRDKVAELLVMEGLITQEQADKALDSLANERLQSVKREIELAELPRAQYEQLVQFIIGVG